MTATDSWEFPNLVYIMNNAGVVYSYNISVFWRQKSWIVIIIHVIIFLTSFLKSSWIHVSEIVNVLHWSEVVLNGEKYD